MALVHADFVEETTTTTGLPGAGSLTLAGATSGNRTFSSAIGNGNTCVYAIQASNGDQESGVGTVGVGTLSRDTLIASSTGSFLDLPSGTHTVYCSFSGEGGEKAYSAAQPDVATDWTAIQDFTAGLTGGADSTTPSTDVTIALDGKAKVIVPSQSSGTITLSFSTPSEATVASAPILIKQGADAKAVAWGSSAVVLGTVPTWAANKSYLFGAFTFDGGTSYYVQVGQSEA